MIVYDTDSETIIFKNKKAEKAEIGLYFCEPEEELEEEVSFRKDNIIFTDYKRFEDYDRVDYDSVSIVVSSNTRVEYW